MGSLSENVAYAAIMVLAAEPSAAVAQQQLTCQSRLIEQTLQKALQNRYGPPASAQIQALASGGRVPETRVTVTDMQTVGPVPGGLAGDSTCLAAASVWREDNGQTIAVTARFWVITDPDRGTQIQLKETSP